MIDFKFAGKTFGFLNPFIIAEIGVNHEGSLDRAKEMIEQVARGGGHAAKFQTYKADKIATRDSSPAYWDQSKEPTASQFELFARWDGFGPEEYKQLAAHCERNNLVFMSTPFDLEAVDMLTPLMPLTKVASADLTNIPLLRRIGGTHQQTIMSVGASTHEEIENSMRILLDAGAQSVTLLHCILNYPTPHTNAQLQQIQVLQERFGDRVCIGYSDHVRPQSDGSVPSLEIAALLGARVIEKHFTDNKQAMGNDHYHAFDESDLKAFVERLDIYRTMYGVDSLDLSFQGQAISNARRRIVAARKLSVGQLITEEDLVALRSNVGIEVSEWDKVVGRKVAASIEANDPILWKQLAK